MALATGELGGQRREDFPVEADLIEGGVDPGVDLVEAFAAEAELDIAANG